MAIEKVNETIVNDAAEEAFERPYTLRKLKDGDLFPVLQLFRKLGLKDFKKTLSDISGGKDVKEVGLQVIIGMADVVIGNIDGEAGDDIYSFWSNLSGISVADMKEMEFGTLPLMIYDTFKEVKNTSFFKVLSKLL